MNYRQDPQNMMWMGAAEGVAFMNTSKETAVTLAQGGMMKKSPVDRSMITTCHKWCGKLGHFANECLETKKDGATRKDATALVNEGIVDGKFEESHHMNFLMDAVHATAQRWHHHAYKIRRRSRPEQLDPARQPFITPSC
jgi:hypothetical protein